MRATIEDKGTDWRHVEDTSEPPEVENSKDCDGCYWWAPCPCGKCEWGVCRNTAGVFYAEYTHSDTTCKKWEE